MTLLEAIHDLIADQRAANEALRRKIANAGRTRRAANRDSPPPPGKVLPFPGTPPWVSPVFDFGGGGG